MRAEGAFTTHEFTAVDAKPAFEVRTGTEVGIATMEKRYAGTVDGRSATFFTAAFDQATGVGTYVAMESFDGTLDGVAGTFNFAHLASTRGTDRVDEAFVIGPRQRYRWARGHRRVRWADGRRGRHASCVVRLHARDVAPAAALAHFD